MFFTSLKKDLREASWLGQRLHTQLVQRAALRSRQQSGIAHAALRAAVPSCSACACATLLASPPTLQPSASRPPLLQPERQLVAQLLHSRDVVAQAEAIQVGTGMHVFG